MAWTLLVCVILLMLKDTDCLAGQRLELAVRLVDGKTPNEGRVEVRYNGSWGTICNNSWDMRDAYVVCHMLNYSKAVTATTSSIRGTGPILLKGLGCTGKEKSIDHCRHPGWGNTAGCDHDHDVGLVCGNLTQEERAMKGRLIGDHSAGQLEIQYNGTWGVVCRFGWDILDVHVICRMLGYKAGKHSITLIEGEKRRRTLLNEVHCSGDEKSIAECYHDQYWKYTCPVENMAGVVCYEDDPPPVKVRLAGGNSANSGRLEVRYHGQWGTVCNQGWEIKDAEVVCRMLGYPGVQEYKTTNFNPVKGIVWLSTILCRGTETSIANCRRLKWGNAACGHIVDVGVTCKKVSLPRIVASRESDESPYTTFMLIFNTSLTEKEKNITKSFQISITKLEVSSFNCYRSPVKTNRPYVTAEILGSSLVENFTIGDGKYYHGYYNAPLEPGSTYRVFVRAVTKAQNGGNNYGEASNATFTTRVKSCKGKTVCYLWRVLREIPL